MPTLLQHLSQKKRAELLRDIYYLNLSELHGFCRKHRVPFRIQREREDGRLVATRDNDRKLVVLKRLLRYLETGKEQGATVFVRAVVAESDPPASFSPEVRLLYGWYDKHNEALMQALRDLTDGTFRNGAVARILAFEFWSTGKAPTLREFASAWLEAEAKGLGVDKGEHPEAAWLTDRAKGEAQGDWKAKRSRKARAVLAQLEELPAP